MLDSEMVISYLGRFTQIQDELAAVGEIVDPDFLVRTALNSFTKPWGSFVRGIVAREVMTHAYLGETLGRLRTGGVEMQLRIFRTTVYIRG